MAAHLFTLATDRQSWLDVGRPVYVRSFTEFLEAQETVLDKKAATPVSQARETMPGVWLGRNVSLHPSTHIDPPVFIGTNSVVGPDVTIGPYAIVGHNCMLDAHSTVTRSVVLPGSYVGEGLELSEVVVDRDLVVNPRLGTALILPEPLLLSSMSDVGVVPPLQAFLSRLVAGVVTVHPLF